MKKLLSFSLMLALIGAVSAADEKLENPFKTAKVGDWVSYKTTIKGLNKDVVTKQTVKSVSDKEVIVELVTVLEGVDPKPTEMKIDLTKPYDTAPMTPNVKIDIKKLDSGKETLTIGDKKYECTWIKNKSTTEVNNMKFTAESKVWTCKDVPLNGIVKIETIGDFSSSTMELVDSGRKK